MPIVLDVVVTLQSKLDCLNLSPGEHTIYVAIMKVMRLDTKVQDETIILLHSFTVSDKIYKRVDMTMSDYKV